MPCFVFSGAGALATQAGRARKPSFFDMKRVFAAFLITTALSGCDTLMSTETNRYLRDFGARTANN